MLKLGVEKKFDHDGKTIAPPRIKWSAPKSVCVYMYIGTIGVPLIQQLPVTYLHVANVLVGLMTLC